jgi:hypothetical protein
MRKITFRKIVGYLSIVAFAICAVFAIVYKFSHVDMTDTRIFLNIWPLYIPLILSVIGSHWGLSKD